MIGFGFCGSYCTHAAAMEQMRLLVQDGYDVQPIFSENVCATDTRFGLAKELIARAESICQKSVIRSIVEAEPLGPKHPMDALIICPCTGNTLAKMANGITDTTVTMAAKAHLRGNRPLILALASNDALSSNLKNIATMLSRKCVYFVPMRQDDPQKKPHSLIADFTCLRSTLDCAMRGVQYQKLFL